MSILAKMKTIWRIFNPVIITVFISVNVHAQPDQYSFDHSLFDELLKEYVDGNGMVNYESLSGKREQLNRYLRSLGNNPPPPDAVKNVQLAYWINLYNAFTTDLILQHYPLKSIKDIGGEAIPMVFATSPWEIEFVNISDTLYTLDKIEHEILRKRFNEPRIHFALVCAAKSCPNLRREAYTADALELSLIHI